MLERAVKLWSGSLLVVVALSGVAYGGYTWHTAQEPQLLGSGTFVSGSGQAIRADYFEDDRVQLQGSDGEVRVLRQVVAASGSRYVNGPLEWWEHHGEATLRDKDQVVFSGRYQP